MLLISLPLLQLAEGMRYDLTNIILAALTWEHHPELYDTTVLGMNLPICHEVPALFNSISRY